MAPLTFSVLVFVAMVAMLEGMPAVTDTQDATLTVTARFLKVDPSSRRHRTLTKQDIDHLGRGEKHHIRIRFDTGLPPLDMYLTQGSVWKGDSAEDNMVVHQGAIRKAEPNNLDANCFLRGKLVRDVGAAVSINRCGKLTGTIQTPDYQYQIEEEELVYPEGDEHPGHATFKVVRTTQTRQEMHEDEEYNRSIMDKINREVMEQMAENQNQNRNQSHSHNNGTVDRSKRQADDDEIFDITIELVAYLDENYLEYLDDERNLRTNRQIKNFLITKWNLAQTGFDDPETVGARVTLALKRVVFWRSNPAGYPAVGVNVNRRLRWFCANTPESNRFDVKVLYTKGMGGSELGMALIGGVCSSHRCMLVKSGDPVGWLELHELGHSLGYPHDPLINGCDFSDSEGGFMGWSRTYRFPPCYRPLLRNRLAQFSHRCLFRENVRSREINVNKGKK